MSTAHMPIKRGTRVQIRLAAHLVSLNVGDPGQLWALSQDDDIAITPQEHPVLRIAKTGVSGVVNSGTGVPELNEGYPYTVYAPKGTPIEFLDRGENVISTVTVS